MKTIKQRRKQNKTDYLKRLKLLKSGKSRVVFRRTNRYVIAQLVESREAQDKVIIGVTSKDLLKFGWSESARGSLKSISASYLIGYLFGKQIKAKKMETPVVDFGMIQSLHKTKVFGFLKGLADAGVEISCDEKCFPDDARIAGEHLKNKIPFEEIKSKIGEGK